MSSDRTVRSIAIAGAGPGGLYLAISLKLRHPSLDVVVHERNRPGELASAPLTRSQLISQAMSDKAVSSGKVTAAEVARKVFDAMSANQFYIYSHPQAIGAVQTRLEDILQARNPTDPFAHKPALGEELRRALRAT